MAMTSINPAMGQQLGSFEEDTKEQVSAKLDAAVAAFCAHRLTSFEERAEHMSRAADVLEADNGRYARIITSEMGKPLKQAVAEIEKCALGCRYYAENAAGFLADEPLSVDQGEAYIKYQPLGVILAIMPWNFPFWQVFRFAAPAIMAGNVGILKHASNVPQCALAVEEIFKRAGFADGVFQSLLIGSTEIARILEDSRVAAATLTGSDAAGRKVASQAGAQLKKTVMELGGSDPFIVTTNADMDKAVEVAVQARNQNSGQSCIAAKRFIVLESIADEFTRNFVERIRNLVVGDPMDEQTQVGPLATAEILDGVDLQVRESVEAGAKVLVGGEKLDIPGNYYAPTVLTNIPMDSPAYRDEVFGPVALLFRVESVDDAIRLANDTRFGLGASVWTNDDAEKDRFISEIESGMVYVNSMVASHPRVPFGGIKDSGYGRELSHLGIREFVNQKTVWVQ